MNKEQIPQQAEKSNQPKQELKELVRLLNTDLKGHSKLYYSLTKIKGISWNLSNAICYILKLDKNTLIGALSDTEVKQIEEFIKGLGTQSLPHFLLNRQKTLDGNPTHISGTDLDLQVRMDIRALREIQAYKGVRHALNLPVRGQRTKAHFRKGKSVGVVRKKNKK